MFTLVPPSNSHSHVGVNMKFRGGGGEALCDFAGDQQKINAPILNSQVFKMSKYRIYRVFQRKCKIFEFT